MDSVINITQIATVDKSELKHRAGRVPPSRLQTVIKGINLLVTPSDPFQ